MHIPTPEQLSQVSGILEALRPAPHKKGVVKAAEEALPTQDEICAAGQKCRDSLQLVAQLRQSGAEVGPHVEDNHMHCVA
ncbi:hypothetical protein A1Q1_02662 [Trichosporon asahii var. asahii CBS 2479]|uniref:Uncharacterized protein n=1 Tax=Trichosporon asahii var. asahii (strain ATCC 90039 / CBS 2479 / JCM 2466 / KCTC 7840 / NBRC 103889/ NCYC 2677 / UAMH 7654) TaxID=1186058 RepID=J6EUV5_TRIAS|nr:hypothetical protein A1Q1_02662 [Trichosporon asahii var. asahii CBS 2479]EJT48379.1 hypothetical protein A1Q1_02662 [Trichosporon asahii var. asahii CBS 2479]